MWCITSVLLLGKIWQVFSFNRGWQDVTDALPKQKSPTDVRMLVWDNLLDMQMTCKLSYTSLNDTYLSEIIQLYLNPDLGLSVWKFKQKFVSFDFIRIPWHHAD